MRATSKTGTSLGVLAAVACAACCALPASIAAGVLSGGAVAFVADGMPVIALALAGTAAVFVLSASRRTRSKRCTAEQDGCRSGTACGCAQGRV